MYVDDAATNSIQAQAYTMGNKIVVRSADANNSEILGHEATHRYHQERLNVKPNIAFPSIMTQKWNGMRTQIVKG